MTEKTAALYRLVMQRIMEVAATVPGEDFPAEVMVSDFEIAIMSTMEETFPNGRVRGCWFHFGQVFSVLAGVQLECIWLSSWLDHL